jgi:hypothetical protein
VITLARLIIKVSWPIVVIAIVVIVLIGLVGRKRR